MAENKEPNIYGEYNPDGSIALNEDGSKKYPDVDLNGGSFTMPATIMNVGGNSFVVIPLNFSDNERLEALKAQPVRSGEETPQLSARPNFQRGQVPTESKEGE